MRLRGSARTLPVPFRSRRGGPGRPAIRGPVLLTVFSSLTILSLAAGATADPAPEPAVRDRIAAGWSRFEQGDFGGAEAAFREAIGLDPSLGEAHRGLAETLVRQGRPREAGVAANAAVPHLAHDPRALRSLAEILGRNEATRTEAIALYRKVLEGDPDDFPARLDLARNLAWSGMRLEAVEECRRVAAGASDPEVVHAARLLEAQAQAWGGNREEALRLYRGLLSERPADPEVRLGEADALAWSGWTRRAESEYRRLVRTDSSAGAHVGLAEIARWQGRFRAAEEEYGEALRVRPDDPRAREGLDRLRREAGTRLQFLSGRFRDSSDWEREAYAASVEFLRRRPLSLRAGGARIRYEQGDGRQIYRTAVPLQASLRPGPGFEGDAGVSRNEYGDGSDTTSYFLRAAFAPGDRARFRIGFDHYDMIDAPDPLRENFYNQAVTVDVVPLGIDLDEPRAGLFLRLAGRWTWDTEAARAEISDGNDRWIGFSRLTYRVPARDTVEWFGQSYYQNTDERSPLYFDPSNFQSHGIGARWQGERSGGFRFLLEGLLSYHPNEDDLYGGEAQAWVEWDLGRHLSLRATGHGLWSPAGPGVSGQDYDASYFGVRLVARVPAEIRAGGAGK
ncbi:MAG: tetratricopeptide repeat protein [Acidobacteria bacterium]|nr:tetratricopeptide repeat protein [Acidobacteriota bacterium]